ncbi:hypothetical protein SPW_5914 [Streptomyces sp. W007]|nr:hypothetical protein SPW_5914 [Streptomyces sp. W007]
MCCVSSTELIAPSVRYTDSEDQFRASGDGSGADRARAGRGSLTRGTRRSPVSRHERGPKAKILAVGYPTVIPQDIAKCGYGATTKFGTITQGDLASLRSDVLEPLNTARGPVRLPGRQAGNHRRADARDLRGHGHLGRLTERER